MEICAAAAVHFWKTAVVQWLGMRHVSARSPLLQVCQEADRFRMSPVNGDAAVESFKHLDLDYLEVRLSGLDSSRQVLHDMFLKEYVQSLRSQQILQTQDTIPSFFKYSPDVDPLMLCATPHVAINYMHAPDYVLQRRCASVCYWCHPVCLEIVHGTVQTVIDCFPLQYRYLEQYAAHNLDSGRQLTMVLSVGYWVWFPEVPQVRRHLTGC